VQSVIFGCPQHHVLAGRLNLLLTRILQYPPYSNPKAQSTIPDPPMLSRIALKHRKYSVKKMDLV
jgi:hypothetical protein